jgi:hypothetical protein
MVVLFYTGDIEHPLNASPLLLLGVQTLIRLSPLIILGLIYRRSVRAGLGFSADPPQRSKVSLALSAALCVWVGLYAWSSYLWMPRGLAFPWQDFWVSYAANLQWLWPAGLAALVFWLVPRRPEAHVAPPSRSAA